jgi:hypothetical protein
VVSGRDDEKGNPMDGMKDTVIASVTLTKPLPNRRQFSATAQLHQLGGNQRPHFSVTGELRNLRRREDNQLESFGQMYDEIREHFPQLVPVMPLHLADDRGVPLYAVENGGYWLGLQDVRPERCPQLDTFAKTWRIDEQRAAEILARVSAAGEPMAELSTVAAGERERWQREANAALALIRSLDGAAKDGEEVTAL